VALEKTEYLNKIEEIITLKHTKKLIKISLINLQMTYEKY